MSRSMVANAPGLRSRPDGPGAPSDSARGAIRAGAVILLVFFGGLGTWAATAPLNSAVIGDAVIKVEGNRKSVQHLDGGIVKELRVHDGDQVDKDDMLLVLDDTAARAEVDVLAEQQTVLQAVEARLQAELDGKSLLAHAPALLARHDASAVAAMDGQIREFKDRQTALNGRAQVLESRIAQLRQEITGNQALAAAYRQQLDSVVGERESLADLLRKELITRTRILQLDRTEAGIRGQIAEITSSTDKAREAIVELFSQIAQLSKDRAAEISSELRQTRTALLDLAPRLQNARATLERTIVRAPYTGTVVGLNVFSVGGVVGRGERILDIVPEATLLVVEARIAVEDIADVHPGMPAKVHFTSYKQRVVPQIDGTVMEISADRLTDDRTGLAYYTASVAIDRDELALNPVIKLYPGMPAMVMITTEERSALDYLVGPLTASFDRAFRQR